MVEVVSSLCFPKSNEYMRLMFEEILGYDMIVGDSFSDQDSLEEFGSYVRDISYPVSLFLRLYVLDCECPCGQSWE